jgi:6-pyruvoyltetrahydropterin/6-carboxytetrahydropterin synthase
MYRLRIQRVFSATHAIAMRGVLEQTHTHDWRIRVMVAGPVLDDDGLLCDFHVLEGLLDATISPFRDANLNDTPPFDRLNPTAEHVAMHMAMTMGPDLPSGLTELQVAVTEAPGCEATYSMELPI